MLPLSAYVFLALLSLAFVAAFINAAWLVPVASICAAALALATGMLSPLGLVSAALLAALCYALFSERTRGWREQRGTLACAALHVAFVLMAITYLAHLGPGFTKWVVLPQRLLSPHSPPFDVAFNFDKPLFAIMVLAFGMRAVSPGAMTAASWKVTALTAVVLYPVVFAFASAAGVVQLDVKLPAFLPVWIVANLLLSSFAEEVFFRGYVQQRLTWHIGPMTSLAFTSLLFGAAHLGAGPLFALAALLAGVGYGWVYWRTRSILAASLIHVGLNTVHFVFFTYPLAAAQP